MVVSKVFLCASHWIYVSVCGGVKRWVVCFLLDFVTSVYHIGYCTFGIGLAHLKSITCFYFLILFLNLSWHVIFLQLRRWFSFHLLYIGTFILIIPVFSSTWYEMASVKSKCIYHKQVQALTISLCLLVCFHYCIFNWNVYFPCPRCVL